MPLKYRDKLPSFKVALERAFDASVAGPTGNGLKTSPTAVIATPGLGDV